METGYLRRKNLEDLIKIHNTQTDFANFINHPKLSQPILSSILNKKRPFHDQEARYIEQKMGIPETWLDKYPLQEVMPLIRKLRRLDIETQEIFNGLLKFIDKNNTIRCSS